MQVRADQLETRLARGLDRVYTLHGDEPLLAMEAADAIRAAAHRAGFTERTVFTASGAHFDWSLVLGAAQELSLFAARRIVEIRIPSGKLGKDGSEALQRCVERADPDLLTLVQLPRLDFQQSKSAWFTALDAAGTTVRLDPVERGALPAWLAQRLARQGQRVKPGEEGARTLAFLADRVEGNLLAAQQEIAKLALLHPAGELGFDQVETAVLDVARYDVAKLAEAVWTGQVARALRMLEGLEAEGESAVFVHWTLAEDLRALARARAALDAGQPLPMALKTARVWGARERWFERVLPRTSAADAARLLDAASACDGLIKGLKHPDWPLDPWQALQRLILLTMEKLAPAPRDVRPGRLVLPG